MRDQINEEVLCVLRRNERTNQIDIDYVNIVKPLFTLMTRFTKLCDNPETSLQQLANFISANEDLNQLTAYYRYCIYLNGSYQAFTANNANTIKEIEERYQTLLSIQRDNPEKFNMIEAISQLKAEIRSRYVLWFKAYSINKTYRICQNDKSILTFSHRIDGWSNPVYQLTPNFSVEIKTNFGYGNSSYFFNKLKYKNIEITPFSEWIDYEIAKFQEIVRYSQSYKLASENWLDAMEYSRDACNLSMTDEPKFVEKYVIEECEKMVSGLEGIFNKDHFTFINREKIEYSIDKKGHVLVEFRGEKISGALDFITKILEFEKIASIKLFISRIEDCNRKIQPMLVEESKILIVKITTLEGELKALKPIYDKIVEVNIQYTKKKTELQGEMTIKGLLNALKIDIVKLDKEFNNKFPEYKEFHEEYKKVTESFRLMTEQLANMTQVYENIITYNEKIISYFNL